MKKILALLCSISVIASTGVTVVSCGDNNIKNKDFSRDLLNDLKVTALGELTIKGNTPTEDELKFEIYKQNQNLDISQIKISEIKNNEAKINIIPKSNIYKQLSTKVTYTIKQKIKLEDVLTEKDLGELTIKGDTPTEEELKAATRKKNPKIDTSQIRIIGITFYTKTAVAYPLVGSTLYVGKEVTLSFSIKDNHSDDLNKKNLNKYLTTKDLGEIIISGTEPKPEEVVKAIGVKNPNVDTSQIKVDQIKVNGNKQYWSVEAKDGSTVYDDNISGTILVSFLIKTKQ